MKSKDDHIYEKLSSKLYLSKKCIEFCEISVKKEEMTSQDKDCFLSKLIR